MSEKDSELLARIDERVNTILERLPTFVSCDRVDALADKVDHTYNKVADHIKDHKDTAVSRNLILGSYISGFAAIGAAVVAIFKK